jgi:short-chain Z-isoprenyl diphosphate synthase
MTVFKIIKGAIKAPFYSLYLHRLRSHARRYVLPEHIGIIMDGNRRFARDHHLTHVGFGHRAGAAKVRHVLNWAIRYKIHVITLWGFAIDNLKRSHEEKQGLFNLFDEKLRELAEAPEIHRNRMRIVFLGEASLLPQNVRDAIAYAEGRTAKYGDFTVNIALAYGGRQEITGAFRDYLRAQAAEGRSLAETAETLDVDAIAPYLYTHGQPEPDLIIRTSGEVRLSGFLLWQSVYSEFFFCDSYWPAFREIDFLRALRSYSQRQRRYGK